MLSYNLEGATGLQILPGVFFRFFGNAWIYLHVSRVHTLAWFDLLTVQCSLIPCQNARLVLVLRDVLGSLDSVPMRLEDFTSMSFGLRGGVLILHRPYR